MGTKRNEKKMYCKICGTENDVTLYLQKGVQHLCTMCAQDTPKKVSKESFCKAFFNTTIDNVKRSILNEFYDDYRTSSCNLKEYIDACTMRE